MTFQIFNISNNKEAINGKWYGKESIKIGDIVVVKQVYGENEVELGEKTREELKTRLVKKQEQEQMNQELYAYMHDIFGADVIEIFDMKFGVDQKKDTE